METFPRPYTLAFNSPSFFIFSTRLQQGRRDNITDDRRRTDVGAVFFFFFFFFFLPVMDPSAETTTENV